MIVKFYLAPSQHTQKNKPDQTVTANLIQGRLSMSQLLNDFKLSTVQQVYFSDDDDGGGGQDPKFETVVSLSCLEGSDLTVAEFQESDVLSITGEPLPGSHLARLSADQEAAAKAVKPLGLSESSLSMTSSASSESLAPYKPLEILPLQQRSIVILNGSSPILTIPSMPVGRPRVVIDRFLATLCTNYLPRNFALVGVHGQIQDGERLFPGPVYNLVSRVPAHLELKPPPLIAPQTQVSSAPPSANRPMDFEFQVIARDNHCVVTRQFRNVSVVRIIPAEWLEQHRLPHRLQQQIEAMPFGLDNISNGLLLRKDLALAFTQGQISFYLNPSVGHYYAVAIDAKYEALNGMQMDENTRRRGDGSSWWDFGNRPFREFMELHLHHSVYNRLCREITRYEAVPIPPLQEGFGGGFSTFEVVNEVAIKKPKKEKVPGRKPGRPRKDGSLVQSPTQAVGLHAAPVTEATEVSHEKDKEAFARQQESLKRKAVENGAQEGTTDMEHKKRGRGRPRKDVALVVTTATATEKASAGSGPEAGVKRGRGRPRKNSSVFAQSRAASFDLTTASNDAPAQPNVEQPMDAGRPSSNMNYKTAEQLKQTPRPVVVVPTFRLIAPAPFPPSQRSNPPPTYANILSKGSVPAADISMSSASNTTNPFSGTPRSFDSYRIDPVVASSAAYIPETETTTLPLPTTTVAAASVPVEICNPAPTYPTAFSSQEHEEQIHTATIKSPSAAPCCQTD